MYHSSKKKKTSIAILGSTGSIGTQTIEVIAQYPQLFEASVLTANTNADLLIQQAQTLQPKAVHIADGKKYKFVKDALAHLPIEVLSGTEALNEVAAYEGVDTVLTALVGVAGLMPTISAIENGKNIALANKETLVVAGELIRELVRQHGVNIYPVDSEHSAIFQCLTGESAQSIEKIILTASGGPFRGKSQAFLENVTKTQALKHPNWTMGAKITIDSASMMNKGLEVIEAKWLFGLKNEQIDVLVHPQSIIHSMVQFVDGSIKAQMGLPDMKLPILYALSYPQRYVTQFPRMDFRQFANLSFETPDTKLFPCLAIAYEAMEKGGNAPCIVNAANELAVSYFLQDKIKFVEIPKLIEYALNKVPAIAQPNLADYIETDATCRALLAAYSLV
ncbi:MAG: 1-deoxy-D-xylulose-5-phosphate reductoisomerase [Chitinophagales bacterium]|nr:1-deoxy-D-xylulose-5-phosphate reductoisomerase [Bacteroidota bacterium]MCB9044416.1 1-deoxy-D-xylulose-5-phosphate reductoisomerase [Chitinophagales bacterium]